MMMFLCLLSDIKLNIEIAEAEINYTRHFNCVEKSFKCIFVIISQNCKEVILELISLSFRLCI